MQSQGISHESLFYIPSRPPPKSQKIAALISQRVYLSKKKRPRENCGCGLRKRGDGEVVSGLRETCPSFQNCWGDCDYDSS
jgi:hypothetical protein